jgi:hypothetical protein
VDILGDISKNIVQGIESIEATYTCRCILSVHKMNNLFEKFGKKKAFTEIFLSIATRFYNDIEKCKKTEGIDRCWYYVTLLNYGPI